MIFIIALGILFSIVNVCAEPTNHCTNNQHTVQHIAFVTGNEYKFHQVKQWLNELDDSIELVRVHADFPEIQSLEMPRVALKKAEEAWKLFQVPLIIDDGGAYLEDYPLFPGTFTKQILKSLGHAGLWKLLQDNPRGWLMQCMVYVDTDGPQLFVGKCDGTFCEVARGDTGPHSSPLSRMFIPDGSTKTFAEMTSHDPNKKLHCRYKSVKQLADWLQQREHSAKS